MISKLLSTFSSPIAYAKEVKKYIYKVSKFTSTRATVVLGGGSYYFYYLYKIDKDFLVGEFPRTLPVTLYRILPLPWFSRLFGKLSGLEIPVILRTPILGGYVKLTGCDLSDAKVTDIKDFKSLSELFQRQLKWDSRLIDRDAEMISPCDGTVLYLGDACDGTIEQVKGVRFTLKGFLGKDLQTWENKMSKSTTSDDRSKSKNSLFFCTIYLAPGDYHRFHSPTECELSYRRYFTGKLLSVNPRLAKLIPGLFSVNERVVYFGQWKYGFFTFSAVGATNVGNIRVFCDRSLPQNKDHQKLDLIGRRKEGAALKIHKNEPITWEKELLPPIKMSRGQMLGKFNLGSSIVLIFEAPSNFQFNVKPGDKIRMGSALGSIPKLEDKSL